jgi:hypothetical protein
MQLRYEDSDVWLAAAMGSVAAPTAVSSHGANSMVAYSHAVTLADQIAQFFTIAVDMTNYVQEIPSAKIRGYTIRTGENGRMEVTFNVLGAKSNVGTSTTNTNSTVGGARAAEFGTRVFRRQGTFRMNVRASASLAVADAVPIAREISVGLTRPLTEDDFVFGQDYIIEPDDNGFPEFPVEVTYARMSTISANSLAAGLAAGQAWKADLTFTGTAVNTITNRSLKWEFPALQLYSVKTVASGPDQVRPVATFRAKLAESNSYMGFTAPMRLTIINANSANLLA